MLKHESAELSEFQEQVCLGTLLGDSSLSRPKGGRSFHLSCYHAEKQMDWLRQKQEWLAPHSRPIQTCAYTDKRDGKTRRGGRFHTISAPCFTELAGIFYCEGTKVITTVMAERLFHPVALACLICDDGSWDKAGIQIATKQFTEKDNRLLAQSLSSRFGFAVGAHLAGKYWNLRIPAAGVERATGICRPYVPDFLLYKFGGGSYRARAVVGKKTFICGNCGTSFDDYESCRKGQVAGCSQKCAATLRLSGYVVRSVSMVLCIECQEPFTPYTKRSVRCTGCR